MRRSASEVIRELEMRIARLEKQSASKEMKMIESLQKAFESQVKELDKKYDSFQSNSLVISDEDLLNPLLGNLDNYLLHLSDNGRGLGDEVRKIFRKLEEVQKQIEDANSLVKEIEDNL